MTIDVSIRELIKSWLDAGYDGTRICSLLKAKASKATVYRWIARIHKSEISAKVSPGRPRNVRTKSFIAKVKRNIQSNKRRKSARKIAREEGCSHKTVQLTIKEDLSLKAYKKIRVPALTDNHIEQRKSFASWIRNHFTRESCRKILFSDEKIFNQDGQYNRQNDVIYAESRENANMVGGLRPAHKYPFKAMVWCGLSYQGSTKVVVLPQKTSFNSDFYITKVLPVAKSEGIRLIGDDFIYQQDGAPSHTSSKTVASLEAMGFRTIGPDIWPANSPDLSPLDYFFWNEVEERLKKKSYKNPDDLVQKIKEAIKEIPQKSIQDSIDDFRSRVHALEKNKGALILNKNY